MFVVLNTTIIPSQPRRPILDVKVNNHMANLLNDMICSRQITKFEMYFMWLFYHLSWLNDDLILIGRRFDPDWTTIWSWLYDDLILIGRRFDPDWTTIWSWLDDDLIVIGRRFDRDWTTIWSWLYDDLYPNTYSEHMLSINSRYENSKLYCHILQLK